MRLELSVRNTSAVIGNLRAFDADLQREIRYEVRESGEFCRDLTRFLAPHRSGFLADHVKTVYSPDGLVFETGWDASDFVAAGFAPYFIFVEEGTQRMPAQPSLGPAYDETRPRFQRNLRAAIRRSVARAELRGSIP